MLDKSLRVSVSITDFAPLFAPVESLFKGIKETGADGIELVIGVKSRWSYRLISSYSERYQLPVRSVHQHIWSGLGVWLDEGVFRIAKALRAEGVVVHPRLSTPLDSKDMVQYFEQLARWQQKYDVRVMLENREPQSRYWILDRIWPPVKEATRLIRIYDIAQRYNFAITYDTSHARLANPPESPEFRKLYPLIGNIHLSSYAGKIDHLPLTTGVFDSQSFLAYLRKKRYQGLLTLEVQYPAMVQLGYNYDAIAKSVTVVKYQ
jgi:sugar phosphate isomerase/epimerase